MRLEFKAGESQPIPAESDYFGNCRRCYRGDGYVNVGSNHYGTCEKCRVYWRIGAGLFSCWMDETQEEWNQNQSKLESFEQVEPARWGWGDEADTLHVPPTA